ncbi:MULTISPECIES: DUF262 domain-containing protein [unclassified Aminobacter]|uniref:DUF262 domain-containing protein n=1 Tax=unclassified Aminobacter TaxID=2644704 RepID=UPI00046716AC|nr:MULTISPECIES: DUF262 domain-containing protein [unclassified Aminobacter]TWH23337.1 hypothetical protein L611_000900000120 [Aminobacter sp. J15]
MQINTSNYSVIEIIEMLDRKELIVNREYQRGSGLWPDGPSSYFIDTILEGYPFPKIYMYEFIDPRNRRMRKEIVDGQQRITTIQRFYRNEFAIKGESRFAGKKYDDLDEEDQIKFVSYPVSVDVIRSAKRAEILQMFRRMNAYTLPLNEAEKRHSSFQGKFKWFVNSTTDALGEFFIEFGVFTQRQIVRMADAELISECILSMERGIVSTSAADLNKLYRVYDAEFPHLQDYATRLHQTFQFIIEELGELRGTHMMKPYALHSLVTALIHARFGIAAVQEETGVGPVGQFIVNGPEAMNNLLTLAQAHEAREKDGAYHRYVWGCEAAVNRAPRRYARTMSVLRAIGVQVPDQEYANLF